MIRLFNTIALQDISREKNGFNNRIDSRLARSRFAVITTQRRGENLEVPET